MVEAVDLMNEGGISSRSATVMKQLRNFRHARNKSIAVRFGFRGRGARPWQGRDIGTSVGSGHGLRHAGACRPCAPVSPRTCSGVQSGPASRSGVTPRFPGHSGPRNKSGVTPGGRRRSRSWARSPRRKPEPDSSGTSPGMTEGGEAAFRSPVRACRPPANLPYGSLRYAASRLLRVRKFLDPHPE